MDKQKLVNITALLGVIDLMLNTDVEINISDTEDTEPDFALIDKYFNSEIIEQHFGDVMCEY
jgi:hypothetical protein